MRVLKFYKEEGEWFLDLKWFPFNKGFLAMIGGAHELLDILSKGKDKVKLQISTLGPIPFSDGVLKRHVKLGLAGGAVYFSKEGYTKQDVLSVDMVWLCPATLWVFLRYPKTIYYKIVK